MGRAVFQLRRSLHQDDEQQQRMMFTSPQQTDRIIYLSGDVDEQSILSVTAQLFSYAAQDCRPIHLVISTYGGCVDEMFSLYDAIQFLPCPVYTIGLGKIMSAGVLLLACGAPGHRQIGENARVMIHSIRGACVGNVFDIINETEEMKNVQSRMNEFLAKHTKMSKQDVEKIMSSGRDRYVSADEALKLGIVDNIVRAKV